MEEKKKDKVKKRTLLQKTVNVFLYAGIVLLGLFMIFFAVSQTPFFRDKLKNYVVEKVNNSINGKISIGKLDGTIFTTVILDNTVISVGKDTLLKAQRIEVKTSPLAIFLKMIHVREVSISNADIRFVKDSTGELNLSKLIKPTPKDTTQSSFPFKIVVSNLSLNNVNFSIQNYKNANSLAVYDSLNLNDLRVKGIKMDLVGVLDISKDDFAIDLHNLSFVPNLTHFDLRNISGKLRAAKTGIEADELKILTANSEINISAQIKGYDIFNKSASSNFKRSQIVGYFGADVNLQDLGDFVPIFKNSTGNANIKTRVAGLMGDFSVSDLQLNYLDTHLNTKGRIYNLDSPKELKLKMDFYNSVINEPDVVKLLPDQKIPDYEKLGVVKIDTLSFDGKPTDFFTRIYLTTPSGNLYIKGNASFEKPIIKYNLNFSTVNFNLSPIINLQTRITSIGQISGQGSNPQNLKTILSLSGDGSVIEGIRADSLRISVNADKKNILYNIKVNSDTSSALLTGIIDFTDEKSPGYDIEGRVKNLNYSEVFKDTVNRGNLNFYINGTGQNLDLNKLNLYLGMTINNSVMNGVKIDSSEATFNIISSDNDQKSVKITSDLADISLNGRFSLPKTISLLVGEANLLTEVTDKKIEQITGKDTLITITKIANDKKNINTKNTIESSRFSDVDQNNEFTFDVKFKDFKLITIFLTKSSLEVDGSIKGKVYNFNDSVHVQVNSNLGYVKFWSPKDVFFLSKLDLGFDFANSFYAKNLNDISAKIDMNTKRVYTGSDIHNLSLNLSLAKSVAKIEFSGGLEDYLHAILQGNVDLSKNEADFDLDSLGIVYNNFDIYNKNNLKFSVSDTEVKVDNFEMIRNQASLKLKGNLLRDGNQNFSVTLNHFRGKDLSENFVELNTTNSPGADINLAATINGNYSEPVISMKLNVDSVVFRNNYLGNLTTDWKYENKNLNLDAYFLDSLRNKSNPLLRIWGDVPVNLSFIGAKERLISSNKLDIKLLAKEFNLSVFGDMIPKINKVRGFLSADLNIKGTWNDPEPHGYLSIDKGRFIAVANNLEYNTGLKLSIDGHSVSLDSLLVQNVEGTENGGTLIGSGNATLENFEMTSSQVYLNGKLKILSETSKAASPQIYGDLVVATKGKIEFSIDTKGVYLKAPINVVSADLTFPQAQRGYKNTYSNFIYRYVRDTTKTKKKELDFESLIALSQQRAASASIKVSPSTQSKFDYTIDVNMKKEAKITFILDQEYNQVLTTVLNGNFKFQQIGGRTSAIGDLKLMDGSILEFLTKTFQAEGSLRFENDLTNPYLDIVATYKNYYYPPAADSAKTSGEVEVAVKLKLKGPLKDLGKSFINNSDNLAVYYGSDNIENDVPDKTKSASDAITFILTGQFLAAQGGFTTGYSQNNALTGTASSLAGSLLGGFLNSYAGDYVRSLELRQVGAYTKFNLSGKVNNFRYTIGGTTDVFSDLSRANVKIEYPFFQRLFLRLERKEALTETNNTSEMINELGLKYQFEF